MSNAKKLSYEMEEPAFLRRMRQAAGGAGRQERFIAPRNRKVHVDDEEDAPAYVLEGGHDTISKAEFEAMASNKREDDDGTEESNQSDFIKPESEKEGNAVKSIQKEEAKQAIADVGGKKKRKAAKIVGMDEDSGEIAAKEDKPSEAGKRKTGGKAKRRVKLSFDDGD